MKSEIPIKNIYYMLAYAFRCLNENNYKSFETEEFDNVVELCSFIIYRGVSTLLKQGLNRDYVENSEFSSTLKGKIEYAESIKNNTQLKKQMVCSFDEFSFDSYMNRILKTTILYLLKSNISSKRKIELKKIIIFFSEVSELDVHLINWNIRYTKNNQTYKMLMFICNLVIEGLIQSESDGGNKLRDFVDDQKMHHLFEKFVLEFYKTERKDINVSASQIPWALDDEYDFMLPTMQTDITLQKNDNILIIDTKYYSHIMQSQFDSTTYRSNNLYQIFSYVKNKVEEDKNKKISGMLLYAKTNENTTPENNTYKMSGNLITIHSLDLNQDFERIKKDLLNIANHYFNQEILSHQ